MIKLLVISYSEVWSCLKLNYMIPHSWHGRQKKQFTDYASINCIKTERTSRGEKVFIVVKGFNLHTYRTLHKIGKGQNCWQWCQCHLCHQCCHHGVIARITITELLLVVGIDVMVSMCHYWCLQNSIITGIGIIASIGITTLLLASALQHWWYGIVASISIMTSFSFCLVTLFHPRLS